MMMFRDHLLLKKGCSTPDEFALLGDRDACSSSNMACTPAFQRMLFGVSVRSCRLSIDRRFCNMRCLDRPDQDGLAKMPPVPLQRDPLTWPCPGRSGDVSGSEGVIARDVKSSSLASRYRIKQSDPLAPEKRFVPLRPKNALQLHEHIVPSDQIELAGKEAALLHEPRAGVVHVCCRRHADRHGPDSQGSVQMRRLGQRFDLLLKLLYHGHD